MAILTRASIERMGFSSFGDNVQISDIAFFYGISRITLGSNVRIDGFCALSDGEGDIISGLQVHIAVYSSFIGAEKITLGDFAISRLEFTYTPATMTTPAPA